MKTFKMIVTSISAVMILVGFVYILILRNRGYADTKQRWIGSGLTLGGFLLLYIASRLPD